MCENGSQKRGTQASTVLDLLESDLAHRSPSSVLSSPLLRKVRSHAMSCLFEVGLSREGAPGCPGMAGSVGTVSEIFCSAGSTEICFPFLRSILTKVGSGRRGQTQSE